MFYTTSELIERAKNLADCGNTDFLSHEECEQYLNDAYNEIYQLAINRGDDWFVKTMNVNSKASLPNDFYSLRSVKGANGYMYKRRSLSATINEPGYEIINNKLVISGQMPTSCEVTYYPLPKHLTLQRAEKEMGIKDNGYEVFDNNSRYFVYYKRQTALPSDILKLVIYDLNNDVELEINIDYVPNNITCSKSTFFVFSDNIYEYDYNGNVISVQSSSPIYGPIGTKSGIVKFCTYVPATKTLTYNGKDYVLEFVENVNTIAKILTTDNKFYYIDTAGNLYEYDKNELEATVIDTGVSTSYLKYKEVDKEDGILYYKNSPMIFSRGFDRSGVIDNIRQVIDCEYTSFYGFTDNYVLYGDGYNVYAKGNLPDVVMNYPNATYFTLIAYRIACYLIAKQGGDVTLIVAQQEKAYQQYYDNVSDAYEVVRIKNVY